VVCDNAEDRDSWAQLLEVQPFDIRYFRLISDLDVFDVVFLCSSDPMIL
jgi:hypothetical protein